MSLQTDSSDDAVTAPLIAWVEKTIGGRVVRCERQPRWRLAYYVDVERDGVHEPFYFRGARGPGATDQLIREGRLLNLVESYGVPAPHYYGYCEEPEGILLAGLSGSEFPGCTPAEQEVLAEEFLAALARWHAIPAEEIEQLGFEMPKSISEHHLMDLDELERVYRASITADSPPRATRRIHVALVASQRTRSCRPDGARPG